MNKYISLANTDKSYLNNKNGHFITNIPALNLKKKYKIALCDFNYVNSIKKNMGKIKINIKNASAEERTNNWLFFKSFNEGLEKLSLEIKQILTQIKDENIFLKSLMSYMYSSEFVSADYIEFNNLSQKLLENSTKLEIYMETNKNKNLSFLTSELLNLHEFIVTELTNLPSYTSHVRDFFIEKNLIEKINLSSKKITDLKNNSLKTFNFETDLIIYDKFSYSEFYSHLSEITKICNNFLIFEAKFNKIIITVKSKSFNFDCDEQIKNFFKCNSNLDKIEFTVPKQITFIKNFYIYTDIKEDNQLFQINQPLLQIIKPEGNYSESNLKTFDRPRYLNVNKTIINNISIKITDQNGEIINFENSPILTIHIIETK